MGFPFRIQLCLERSLPLFKRLSIYCARVIKYAFYELIVI